MHNDFYLGLCVFLQNFNFFCQVESVLLFWNKHTRSILFIGGRSRVRASVICDGPQRSYWSAFLSGSPPPSRYIVTLNVPPLSRSCSYSNSYSGTKADVSQRSGMWHNSDTDAPKLSEIMVAIIIIIIEGHSFLAVELECVFSDQWIFGFRQNCSEDKSNNWTSV